MASATHHPGRFGHIYFHTDNHDLDTILIPTIVTQPFVEPEIVSNRTSWGSFASATHYAGRFRHIYFHTDKGSFKNYVDKIRRVGGQKMLLFVHV